VVVETLVVEPVETTTGQAQREWWFRQAQPPKAFPEPVRRRSLSLSKGTCKAIAKYFAMMVLTGSTAKD